MLQKLMWISATILLTLTIAVGEPVAMGDVEGRLLKVVGKVQVERYDSVIEASPKMEILGGDIIVTGAKSEATVDLGEGRIITIHENSHFEIDERGAEDGDGTSCALIYGMVYVRRSAGAPAGKPFEIQTPSAVAGVRGTQFAVAVAPDGASRFGVEEGEINLETEGGASAVVGLMQETTVDSWEQSSLQVQQYAPDQNPMDEWRRQRLDRILKNPLPALRKLAMNLNAAVTRGDRLMKETEDLADQMLDWVTKADNYRKLGQHAQLAEERSRIRSALPRLIGMVRRLVRLDNRIQSRIRLLKIILQEARAEGSPTPPRQLRVIEQNIDKIKAIEAEARELHRRRARFMRTKLPELKEILPRVK